MSARSGPLVDAATLAAELAGDAPPTVLDARWRLAGPPGEDSYREGHLPGAVFTDLGRVLAGPPGGPGGRHPLPDAASFQAAMRAAGVSEGHPVVVYDDGDAIPAARAWWTLRYFGHPSVRVLDGGFRAWTEAGLPVVTEAEPTSASAEPAPAEPAAAITPGDFTARPGGMPVLDADGAAAIARTGVLLDARAAERYRGETEPVDAAAGHIPGARNAPAAANFTESGQFLPPGQLAARYAEAGAAPGQPVAVYCGSGVSAATDVLALQLAGLEAALYVGSWSGWLADPAHPVATGPDPG